MSISYYFRWQVTCLVWLQHNILLCINLNNRAVEKRGLTWTWDDTAKANGLDIALICVHADYTGASRVHFSKTIYIFVADWVEGGLEHNSPYWEQLQPYFDNTTRREVTTTVGQTAHLHCRVRNLGDRAVRKSPCIPFTIHLVSWRSRHSTL